MSYEQLLEFEERNGKVSKGLTLGQKMQIPSIIWKKPSDTKESGCSICFDEFESGQRLKVVKKCEHEYHSVCLDEWLSKEKRCPMCNESVLE
mmetsp:Transcript_22425/g.34692  ORF Transcript_22425/g.34692 Transcript_22425/m.34692 type:complete len:92 (-) Transcript_22425:31-306(-)